MNQNGIPYRLAAVVIIGVIALVGLFYVDRAAAVNTIPDQDVLFSDDFSGDLSQWNNQGGTWYIDQGELVGEGNDGGASIYAGDLSWTDYVLKAKIIFVNNEKVRLMFRSTAQTKSEYYVELGPQVDGNNGTYTVSKYKDDVFWILYDSVSPIPITNPSEFMIEISGNQLIIYINGQYVNQIEDSDPLLNGRFGLGLMFEQSARFDDVSITTLPPIMLNPPGQTMYGQPGDTIEYTLELENHTGASDSFNLEVQDGTVWTTTLSTNMVGPISDGDSITFTAQVNLPLEVQPGEFDVATIQATSVTSPSLESGIARLTSKNTKIAYVISAGQLVLIDAITYSVIDIVNLGNFGCGGADQVKLTPDGSQLYITCPNSGNLIILDTKTNLYITQIVLPVGGWNFAFTEDGEHALLQTEGHQILVLDTKTYDFLDPIPINTISRQIAIHPSKPLAYVIENYIYDSYVAVIDTTSFTISNRIHFDHTLTDIFVSPDGRWVYVSTGEVEKIDTSTNMVVSTFDTPYLINLEITQDGFKLYGANYYQKAVDVYNTVSESSIAVIKTEGEPFEFELDCTQEELYVANTPNNLTIINTLTDQIIINIPMSGSINAIAVCPDYSSDLFTRKIVRPAHPSPGSIVTYTISAINISSDNMDTIAITDTVPVSLTYQEGSLTASSGSWEYQDGVVYWKGSVPSKDHVDIQFRATIPKTMTFGTTITNSSKINTPAGYFVRSTIFDVGNYQNFIPCAYKACPPFYYDDFSNPASGWAIEGDNDYSMGYANNEYYIGVNEGWIAWSMLDFGVSDFRVEMDARASANVGGGTGLMFEINEYGFYLFEISDGWFALWRVDAYYWNWTPLIDWTYSSAIRSGYQTNRMKVERIGNDITVYANGQKLGSVNDSYHHGTRIGMTGAAYSGYFDGRFDNFTVYEGSCVGSSTSGVLFDSLPSSNPVWATPGSGHTRP